MTLDVFLAVAGLAAIIFGSIWLVTSVSRLGAATRMKPATAALTWVALIAAFPELLTSVAAATSGSTGIAFGNAVGSSIANVGLVLGLGAVLTTFRVTDPVLKSQIRTMALVAVVVGLMAFDGSLDRTDGFFLIAVYLGHLVYSTATVARHANEEHSDEVSSGSRPNGSKLRDFGFALMGLVLLAAGAKVLAESAIGIAREMGWDEVMVGLVAVAAVTSLPRLIMLVTSARGEGAGSGVVAIASSNVANLTVVLGVTAAITPITLVPATSRYVFAAVVVFSSAMLPLIAGRTIGRPGGVALLAAYVISVAGAIVWVFA